jgi:serine/threonine protein kinase
MQPSSGRWHIVTESEFPHEREGLAHAQAILPDRAPFHAWSNFEFRDGQGKWWEVDLLVLGEGRLHLVELKHYQGRITGNAYTWNRGNRSEESPLRLARRKAQRLASVLKDAAKSLGITTRVPFVQECVFLHAESTQCLLPQSDKSDLFGLPGREPSSGLPSLEVRLLEPDGRAAHARMSEDDVLRVIDKAGFAVRREREVGSWRITGEALAEAADWQDWPAEHKVTRQRARIRFFTAPQGAPQAQIAGLRQLAEREYALTSRLHHEGIIGPRDIVEDDLGSGLVFPHDPDDQRLDLWLTGNAAMLDVRAQVALVRQLAEAVHYAHNRGVVHRGLSPKSVMVHVDGKDIAVRIRDWQVAGVTEGAKAQTKGMATRIFRLLDQRRDDREHDAYIAPEGQWAPQANRAKLDVFALGALTYLLVSGHDPATSRVELNDRLERERGLDLAADLPQVPGTLRRLVLEATTPTVSDRLDGNGFLERLSAVERELGASSGDTVLDPLDAPPGTLLGDRFELIRRLGSGSTAVGLLVTDRTADDQRRVLKVAKDDAAARRLDDEADVLSSLGKRRSPRLVRIVEPTPLQIGDRKALLLESAGEETLADVLRERRRLSLDLLERWGGDLLEALVALDAAGVDHRDIKPANLGVREQRGDRAKHLVLFDFSLTKASASSISAGTPPYLDPFLGTGKRLHWDSAAERYAATVTLFEMATGHAPVFGDGETAPRFVDKATIDPGDFDPTVADSLVAFFERALDKDASKRFGTAAEMLSAWRSAIAASTSTAPEDADEIADRATPDTPLPQSGLSPRALSALEPFRLRTVGDLAALDTGRLSRFTGIVDATKREIRGRAKQWRKKFGAKVSTSPDGTEANPDDPFSTPEDCAQVLVKAAGSPRARARRTAAAVLLGLEGTVSAFATHSEIASALGLGGQPQVSVALAGVRDEWAKDPEAAALLDRMAARVCGVLDELDGAAWTDTVVHALAAGGADDRSLRLIGGLVRASLDRAEDKAKGADEEPPVARHRRRRDNRVLLARSAAIADKAGPLGVRAAELVAEAVDAGEFVVARGRSVPALRQIWTIDLPPLDDVRLIRLAARMADEVAASNTGELYSTKMPIVDAVRFALGSTTPSQRFTPSEIKHLVHVRFPGVAAVPGRPGLDRVLEEAGTGLVWDGDAYAVPSSHSDTTFNTQTNYAIPVSAIARSSDPTIRELEQSVRARSYLALGVLAKHTDQAVAMLRQTFDATEVNVTDVLLDALKANAEKYGVPWDEVLAADAAEPQSVPAQGLGNLVQESTAQIEAAIASALKAAPAGTKPVLLTEAAPLARYGQMGVLSRLADITTGKDQGVWLIVPRESGAGAMLDQVPVPLTYASQFLPLDPAFVASEGDAR